MNNLNHIQEEGSSLLGEIRVIHQELSLIHRETLSALASLAALIKETQDIKIGEHSIDRQLGEIHNRLARLAPQAPADTHHCKVCGATVQRHHAAAGYLLCCPVCNWSEFVNSDGSALAETTPPAPPTGGAPDAWAA
jgi:hypothetical protein